MIEFFLASLIVAIAPGPDNLFVLAQSSTHGTKSGILIILGLCTGIMIQTLFLVVGVSALILASPMAFFILQCLGALYLIYLAYKSFQVRSCALKFDYETNIKESNSHNNVIRLYLRGIIMNLTNPKAILFCLSFIPPSVNISRKIHPSVQIAILGAEFVCATFLVFSMVAFLAGFIKKYLLNSPRANRNLNWISGVIFLMLAFSLFVF